MKTEQEFLREIFNENYTWKGKNAIYDLHWCSLCQCPSIVNPKCNCHGSSCNGSGCPKCGEDFDTFHTGKTNLTNYISNEEYKIYSKILKLQEFMLESLSLGEKEIDWKRLVITGQTCQNDHRTFKEFIDKDWHYEPNNS